MSTYTWTVPSSNLITGTTYIKDTDNKIQATIDDLADFVNGEGSHDGQGLTYDLVDKLNAQTITGIKTFSNGIIGNVAGDLTGNADTATALETARTIAGQSFDGTANIFIAPTDLTDVTADATEINTLDGITATTTELNYASGVTSSIQTQINSKQDTLVSGTNIKTINGTTLLGAGDLVTEPYNDTDVLDLFNATGSAPVYACRAWVNFDGTSSYNPFTEANGAIRGSGNVSSVTDNGTGDYTVNFTTAMVDDNYSISFGVNDFGNDPLIIEQNRATSSIGIRTTHTSDIYTSYEGFIDAEFISMILFR